MYNIYIYIYTIHINSEDKMYTSQTFNNRCSVSYVYTHIERIIELFVPKSICIRKYIHQTIYILDRKCMHILPAGLLPHV